MTINRGSTYTRDRLIHKCVRHSNIGATLGFQTYFHNDFEIINKGSTYTQDRLVHRYMIFIFYYVLEMVSLDLYIFWVPIIINLDIFSATFSN